MTEGNPFRDFWNQLKGRGELLKQRKGRPSIYRVTLTTKEVLTLGELNEKYRGVFDTVERVTGMEFDFRTNGTRRLNALSNLKPRK